MANFAETFRQAQTLKLGGLANHSSEIRGLCSMKWPSEMLQNLLYFIYLYKNPKLLFPFRATLFFSPNEYPGLCHIDQRIRWGKK